MHAPLWYCSVLLLSAAGCGRLGVQLRLFDADAGGPRFDAGRPTPPVAGRAAGAGGMLDAGIDSGRPYQNLDAGTMLMPVDAGAPSSCGGARQLGLCWYLAAADSSCNDACASRGGFDSRALGSIGTAAQGGSESECEAVLTALGRPGAVAPGTQQIGLGCHVWSNGDRWWLQSPAFSPNAATPSGTGARIACACQR